MGDVIIFPSADRVKYEKARLDNFAHLRLEFEKQCKSYITEQNWGVLLEDYLSMWGKWENPPISMEFPVGVVGKVEELIKQVHERIISITNEAMVTIIIETNEVKKLKAERDGETPD